MNDKQTAPSELIGEAAIGLLRQAGYVVVPVDPPDYAVGEVMIGTGCHCPNRAWDALNSALNWMGIELPSNVDLLSQLGAGDLPLEEWRASVIGKPEEKEN